MGCVSSVPPDTSNSTVTNNYNNNEDNMYKPTNEIARQLEYPRIRNEIINNPYSINDWIEICEHLSNQWVVATIIDKQNNWIRILSQSPNMQFTDKLHLICDRSRIRPLGSTQNNDNNTNKRKENDDINNKLNENGLELINEIKYDVTDNTMDTIYKSFEYQLNRVNINNINNNDNNDDNNNNNDEFKQYILTHINDKTNDEYFNQFISNWSHSKYNNHLLKDKDHIIILSHFCKFNVILYQFNDSDLQIIFEHKYNDNDDDDDDINIVRLLYIPKIKQYQLLSLTMDSMIKLINNDTNNNNNNNNDYKKWNVEQILKWLNIIEFGIFRDNKYNDLKQGIQRLEINGSNIIKMNDLTLKSMGMNDTMDQKLIIENIEKLVSRNNNKTADNNNNNNDNDNNNDIIEEEQEYVTPGGGCYGGRSTRNESNDYFEIPEEYLDPIHYTIMRDPVLSIVSGHTFERQSITEWINANHTDPINQKQLDLNQLVPNRTLREAIDRFIKIYGSEFTQTKQ